MRHFRRLAAVLQLTLEGSRALWLYIAHDNNTTLRIVPKLDREARNGLWCLRDTLLAVNVSVGQEGHFA